VRKDADVAAVEEEMKKDKKLSQLVAMPDESEMDPTQLMESYDEELLSINSIELTLLV